MKLKDIKPDTSLTTAELKEILEWYEDHSTLMNDRLAWACSCIGALIGNFDEDHESLRTLPWNKRQSVLTQAYKLREYLGRLVQEYRLTKG